MDNYEKLENIGNLADYFTSVSGHPIDVGLAGNGDIWISSNRTNGREYLDSVSEAERRLELLYSDFMIDDGSTTDPLEGF